MARIRSIKPESLQHRKVGRLSDRAFRVWLSCLTQADDAGRLVCDAEQIRVWAFAYHPKVSTDHVERAIQEVSRTGLMTLYGVGGIRYACFPSWKDHQKIDRPTPSKIPPCKSETLLEPRRALDEGSTNASEDSSLIGSDRIRSDRRGSDRRGSEGRGSRGEGTEWGTPQALVALYNDESADECPAVEKLTPARAKKCREYLQLFPDKDFWVEVFQASKSSAFLRGLKNRPGHEHFVMSLDWLLSKGKQDQVENCVKVFEGRYRDG